MNQINDDIVDVCDALDILSGRKRSTRPQHLVAHDAIAAWERVDKALYAYFAKAILEQNMSKPTAK
jgi:predicted cupin superfamily sugar epimerase